MPRTKDEAISTRSTFKPDRFCVLGPVESHVEKLAQLRDAGVDQFNIYLMNGDEESTLDAYGQDVIPAVRAAGS